MYYKRELTLKILVNLSEDKADELLAKIADFVYEQQEERKEEVVVTAWNREIKR